MPISAYTIRTARVPLGKDNDFEVRALTFPDLTMLITNHMPALVGLLAKYQQAKQDVFAKSNIMSLCLDVARDFPTLASEIISLAIVGETVSPETRTKIENFPAPIQMQALVEIARITVEEAGGLGNLMAGFRLRVQGAMAETSDLSPIQN